MSERAGTAYQITVDCAEPDRMARFWALALGYELEGPPSSHGSWREYWISVGVPEDEVEEGYDSIVDPDGIRPRVWFQHVPESKTVKNRLHFDLLVGGGRKVPLDERKRLIMDEAARLADAGALKRRAIEVPESDHFFVAMADPEGNEFDIV